MRNISKDITEALKKEDIAFKENILVDRYSSFRVGGEAALAVFPDTQKKLVRSVEILDGAGVRCEILGNASNVLFAFDSFDGALIFTSGVNGIEREGNRLICDCGTSLTYLATVAASYSLSGLEFAYGIPGLVGGSVYMNAGAYGSEIANVLKASLAYDRKGGKIFELDDHGFAYRKSVYMSKKELVCLGAEFELAPGDEAEIKKKMQENMRSRQEKQPLEYPSAGSYFKRPEGHFAGKLIEDCGLKGVRIGGAEVSVKHAGFIVNRGGASYGDILALEKIIKERVMSEYGVSLEREIRLITK